MTDWELRIDVPNGLVHGVGDGAKQQLGRDLECHPRHVVQLTIRPEERGRRRRSEVVKGRIFDDAHNAVDGAVTEHCVVERVARRKERSHEGAIHDDHRPGRSAFIMELEPAPLNDRHAHGLEEVLPDIIDPGLPHRATRRIPAVGA